VLNETKTRELLDTTVAVASVVVATSSSYILHEGLWYKKWIEINTLLLLQCWCFFGSFENYPLSLLPSSFFPADFCVGNLSAISWGQVNQHSPANHAPWTVVCTAKFTFLLYSYPIELTIVVTYVLTIHMHLHTEFLIFFSFEAQFSRPNLTNCWHPQVKLIGQGLAGLSPAHDWVCGLGGWRRKINHHNNLESLIVLWCKAWDKMQPVLYYEAGINTWVKVDKRKIWRLKWPTEWVINPSSTFVRRPDPLWKEKARQENCVFLKWSNVWIKKCTIHYVQQTLLTLWASLLYLTIVKRVSNCAPNMHSLPTQS